MHRTLIAMSTLLCLASVGFGEIRFVDRTAPQNGDGLTWETAYRSLRGACTEATTNGDITEIWVAANEYNTNGTPFELRDGIQIYGGFVGGEADRNDRDPFLNPTYVDAQGTSAIFGQGNIFDVYFDGLIFRNALVGDRAGAVFCAYNGSATFVNCKFNNNYTTGTANLPPSGGGGAVGVYHSEDGLRFVNCVFRNNRAYARGGAVALYSGILEFTGCLFIENQSLNREGGAIHTYTAETLVNMCTFWGNEAGGVGGAIDNYRATLTIYNSILWDNQGDCGLVTGCPIGIEIYYWPPEGIPDIQSSITPLGDFIDSFRHFRDDPLFINAPGDLVPFALSPAVDAGDNTRVPNDVYDVDRDGVFVEKHPIDCLGNPRFVDAGPAPDTGIFEGPFPNPICDMGALEFQDDCNGNGVPDLKDTGSGSSEDCDGNGLPDECEIDCDGDGVVDVCAAADGLVPDCNENLIPDSCEIASNDVPDIDENGIPDECEDCNNN
ncbi:MAG: right-handed parallel beta-helix repeat-containing protein, partial [Phycisphaerales bacterium]|nr:right-handed parallel beta-helix repeat-containing protein [Phycisphaerales bacterium]